MLECNEIWYESSFGRGESSLFKRSPKGHVWPGPRNLYYYIVIYKEMLKKLFPSRTNKPISTKLDRKHAWGLMEIQI